MLKSILIKNLKTVLILFCTMVVVIGVTVGAGLIFGEKAITETYTIGTVSAAGTPDYTCDGTADNVEFQQALDALPANGGKICVLAGDYNFEATVLRAIDNVIIEGVGAGATFSNNNSTPLFSAGIQNDWAFRNFTTDNGGVTIASATNTTIENALLGTVYYAEYIDVADSVSQLADLTLKGYLSLDGGAFDTTLQAGTPSESVTYTLPSADGINGQFLQTDGNGALTWASGVGDITAVGDGTTGSVFTADGLGSTLYFEGSSVDEWEVILTSADPSGADFTVTIPATTGTLITTGDTGSVTNTMLAGSIDISDKTNLVAGSNITLTDDTLNIDSTVTLDTEWDSIGEIESATSVNIIVSTELDAESELEALLADVSNVFTNNDTIDISSYTNLVAGTNITLTDDTLNVDDVFLLHAGDTATGDFDFTGAEFLGGTPLVFEGTTNDGNVTSFVITDPDGVRTITFPNASGEVTLLGQTIGTGEVESGITLDSEWNTIGEIETVTGVNIIVSTEIDAESELEGLLGDVTNVFTNNDTIDISSYTNLVAGTNITLSDDTLNVDDAFLLNNGDTGTGDYDFTGAILLGANALYFEGSTDDDYQLIFAITDITGSDKTVTFPNATGEVSLLGQSIDISDETNLVAGTNITLTDDTLNVDDVFVLNSGDILTGNYDLTGGILLGASPLLFEGSTDDDYQLVFAITDITTSDKTVTWQDYSGIVVLDGTACYDLEGTGLSITTGVLNWAGVEGEGIDLSGSTISCEDASTTNKGIASFNTDDFSVTSGAVSLQRQRNFILTAGGMWPSTTGGCAANTKVEYGTNDVDMYHLDFDPDSDESCQVTAVMPDDYNGGTVTAVFYWTTTGSGASETVIWGIQGLCYANDEAIDAAFGTAQTVSDDWIADGDLHVTSATSAITLGGTPAAGELVQFRIYRDADNGSDDMLVDARLIQVKITFTGK